jgi:hypothetical protein
MYKASYTDGQKWFEWLKMRPSEYLTYRVNGDGSTTGFELCKTAAKARKWVQFMNDNYATDGGKLKVFKSTDGVQFLSKATFDKLNKDDEGYPLCPIYKEKVLPDEQDLCSMCHQHSASVTWGNSWATLEQLKITATLPF